MVYVSYMDLLLILTKLDRYIFIHIIVDMYIYKLPFHT